MSWFIQTITGQEMYLILLDHSDVVKVISHIYWMSKCLKSYTLLQIIYSYISQLHYSVQYIVDLLHIGGIWPTFITSCHICLHVSSSIIESFGVYA